MTQNDYEIWLNYFKLALTGAAGADRDATNLVQRARLIATKAVKEMDKVRSLVKDKVPLTPAPGSGREQT